MLKNNIKIFIRYLLKNRIFSFVNVFGLAIGMTACLLILHYVHYEKSYDRFHPDIDRIYRLRVERIWENGEAERFASCCPPAAPIIREGYPEVEKIARIYRYQAVVSHQDMKFLEERLYFAEPDFLAIFNFPFIKGDPINGIRRPDHAFISQSMAQKYFGDQDPMGKTFKVDGKVLYQVAGVFKDIPANSHVKFDFLLSYENLISLYGEELQHMWGHTMFYTYLRLKPQADPRAFEAKLSEMLKQETREFMEAYNLVFKLVMQPVQDIHLTSHYMQEYEANSHRSIVDFLFLIAIFIIVIANVNYVNLSTALSLDRAKEVGLRKTIGASRLKLVQQFFLEVMAIHAAALCLTLFCIELLLPQFCQITNMPLHYKIWIQNWFLSTLFVMFGAGVLLSGFYPVTILSSYEPAKVLKGQFKSSSQGIFLRKGLVIFQFIIALALIISTMTIYRQISFMQQSDLGFDREQILVVKTPRVRDDLYDEKFKSFKQSLLMQTQINNLCSVTEVPGRPLLWDNGAIRKAGEDAEKGKNYLIVGIDDDFADVFNMKIIHGRNFSISFSTEDDNLILNEAAIRFMGFNSSEEAVGQKVNYWEKLYTIVGVLKDYHQQSLKIDFSPQIFRYMPSGRGVRGYYAIKLNTEDFYDTIQLVGKSYAKFFPGNPFEYFFLDEYFNQQYKSDMVLGKVFGIFSALAIIITGLGLFALSSFSAAQRTREIGIRKVLGADVRKILSLLVRDFIVLLILSFVMVFPLSFIGLNRWLDNYAFRIALEPWLFILPLFIVAFITLASIAYQVIKSAGANPVDSLRYE